MANRDMSDLVANADTNLAVAAVGDYLLIYDISEPVDVNKIKVITAAHLIPPVITARQGGSPTDWATSGITNYVPATSNIQVGARQMIMGNGTNAAYTTITFPEAFAHTPIVIATIQAAGTIRDVSCIISAISTTTVVIDLYRTTVTTPVEFYTVNWMAIGSLL